MDIDQNKIKEILVRENYLSQEDLAKAEAALKGQRLSLVDYLLVNNLITKDLLGQALAETFSVPYFDLNSSLPTREQVLRLPENWARKYNAVIAGENKTSLTVATDDPGVPGLAAALSEVAGKKTVKIAYALTEDIEDAFIHYRQALQTRFAEIVKNEKRVAPEILDEIFSDAYDFRASDIHFEPQGPAVLVRFRIDGVLREAGRIPAEFYENIINRVKVTSNLRIDEHYSAQDGSLQHESNGRVIDMRTSIVPTVAGEKIVLRVLSAYTQGLSLTELGLNAKHQAALEAAGKKPFGMILVTGPTGSGKTTTLYGLLKILNNPDTNITTIEDPVEYKILGLNQIQVNPQTDLTFAKGLRSIVRQDPDTILVGEIRDHETAEIAVNAALTGHLLFSTFHANDAATAIPRLLDMEIEPFLLASTLELVIAQRLIRKICQHCRFSVSTPIVEAQKIWPAVKTVVKAETCTLYKGKGCGECNGTGYKGRTAIFELIKITPEMEALMLAHPSSSEIWQLARGQGAASLFEDGWEKVLAGISTLEELRRVAEPPADIK